MSKPQLNAPQVCLVTDVHIPNLVERIEAALAAGITMLQLRDHQMTATELYALARKLRPLCQQYAALFIVNDRIDVGLAMHADGFQLSSRSLPLAIARQIVGPEYLLGASVHSLEEAYIAIANGADFLLAGTIFASHSHPDESTHGLELVGAIKCEFPTYPLLAIGGITPDNARQVMNVGADGIAAISAILGVVDIEQSVRELRQAIGLEKTGLSHARSSGITKGG